MEITMFAKPLAGGVLLGCSAIMLLLFNGRIAGISGILGGIFSAHENDKLWRVLFIAGMILGGIIATPFGDMPDSLGNSPYVLAIAGLLVGMGTRIGNGCTSGHGICGIGRLSLRSIVATLVFMATAALTVFIRLHQT